MKKIVVDSDIIIDFLRTGEGYFPKLVEKQAEGKLQIYLSSVTVMELLAGESASKDEEYLLKLVGSFKVEPFGTELAKLAGRTKRGRKLQIALADFIIGMTAIKLKAVIATRNKAHFKGISELKFYS